MLITKSERSAGFYFSNTLKTLILIGVKEKHKDYFYLFIFFVGENSWFVLLLVSWLILALHSNIITIVDANHKSGYEIKTFFLIFNKNSRHHNLIFH